MSDLISRQSALKACCCSCYIDDIIEEIQQLPSAEPEQKKGKWIQTQSQNEMLFTCSCCEAIIPMPTFMGHPFWEFCPRCGAFMGGETSDG